jgi:hypothetical protein
MKKILFTLTAVLCITTTAMAQTSSTASGKYSDSIPQRNLTQMSLDSMQNEDTDSCQSIMLRHRKKNAPTQYQFKRAKYMTTGNEDGLKGFRDYIVRKRRIDEGRPLQPLPLDYFRRW